MPVGAPSPDDIALACAMLVASGAPAALRVAAALAEWRPGESASTDSPAAISLRMRATLLEIRVSFDGAVPTRDAARLLGKTPERLRRMRSDEVGPPWRKAPGGRVEYLIADLADRSKWRG